MAMTIGELASRAGVATSAVRYYESAGILPKAARVSGRRVYDSDALHDLMFVTRARSAGFDIAEIRELAALVRDPHGPAEFCEPAKDFARTKIDQLDKQIAKAKKLRVQLTEAVSHDCTEHEQCSYLAKARMGD